MDTPLLVEQKKNLYLSYLCVHWMSYCGLVRYHTWSGRMVRKIHRDPWCGHAYEIMMRMIFGINNCGLSFLIQAEYYSIFLWMVKVCPPPARRASEFHVSLYWRIRYFDIVESTISGSWTILLIFFEAKYIGYFFISIEI